MASFREILRSFFPRTVVIKQLPGKRLKAIDVNKMQSTGSPTVYSNRSKWRNGRNFNSMSGYGSGFTNEEIEALRRQMYLDYELMDTDAIVNSVIDIVSDETTTKSIDGQLLVIKTEDERVKKVLHNLFYDVLNIEFNLWSWVRTMVKYGDAFLYLDIREEVGVVNVMAIHPSLMIREEGNRDNPYEVRFRYEGDYGFQPRGVNYFEEFEIAHFRLLGDTNFNPYGKSYIESARKAYKVYTLMLDAMLIHRIMRAPERRLIKVDIGNIPPNEIDQYIQEIASEMKKTPYIDPVTGDYNLRYNIQAAHEDWFMPVRGDKSGTSIDVLPGLQNSGQSEDVEFTKDLMLAALKVPKEYLGYQDGAGGKANLSMIDIRFARTIERIQKIFVSELYKIALIHLKVQGFSDKELLEFELELTNPSLVFERQKTDVLTAKVDLVKSMQENNLFSDKFIYEQIFGMSEDEWKADRERVVEDAKHKFRMKQITEEGNDPKLTGKSFGTPWDIATMQVASKFESGQYQQNNKELYTPDEREENEGKPQQFKGSFETKRDKDFGPDPAGRKDNQKMPLSNSAMEALSKLSKKGKEIQFLNENNILDE